MNNKLKTLIPMDMLEQEAQNQIYEVLKLDFLKILAIMPDCHAGYLLVIGGVALLDNVISPGFVGYDEGCGMCLIVTEIKVKDLSRKDRKKLFKEIIKKIPTGFSTRETGLDYHKFKSACGDKNLDKKVEARLHIQLGTLGGGNHFIELGENREGFLTITIHSGSRNPGHTVAGHYISKSKIEDKHLPNGFLDMNNNLGKHYLEDLLFMQQYALDNRLVMMREVADILKIPERTIKDTLINENHNHAIVTPNGVLHRKGATPAEKDKLGVIPGNMRDGVYITRGLGNEEYLSSASHGAGRKMSRTKAHETLELREFKEQMKGIIAVTNRNVLDEAPDAYKNLGKVIKMQEGIVIDVVDFVKPIINVKADEEDKRRKQKAKKKWQQERDAKRKAKENR